MDLENIKRGLQAEIKKIKKRENEQYAAFQCNVRQMCKNVLAKLEEQESVIEELKGELHNVSGILNETREWLIESQKLHKRCADNAVKKIRHNKYKRCLAMADKCVDLCNKAKDLYRWAEDENLEHHYSRKIEFFARWHNRWQELAQKFKEAK